MAHRPSLLHPHRQPLESSGLPSQINSFLFCSYPVRSFATSRKKTRGHTMFSIFKKSPYQKVHQPRSPSFEVRDRDRWEQCSPHKQITPSLLLLSLIWSGSVLVAFFLGIILTRHYIGTGRPCQESDLAWGEHTLDNHHPYMHGTSTSTIQANRKLPSCRPRKKPCFSPLASFRRVDQCNQRVHGPAE